MDGQGGAIRTSPLVLPEETLSVAQVEVTAHAGGPALQRRAMAEDVCAAPLAAHTSSPVPCGL